MLIGLTQCCRFTLAETLQSSVLYIGKMLVCFRKTKSTATQLQAFYLATRPEIEGFRNQDLFRKPQSSEFCGFCFTLRKEPDTPSPTLLYQRITRVRLSRSTRVIPAQFPTIDLYLCYPYHLKCQNVSFTIAF